jgi:hydroxypyruvate isomerase
MNRRDFLAAGAVGLGAALGAQGARGAASSPEAAAPRRRQAAFKLKYAPHFGMFRHHAAGLVEQIDFMAEQGFTALEDNGMRQRPVAEQEAIRAAMDRHGMEMGVFVATAEFHKPTFGSRDKAARERILADIRDSVEVAKRVRARWVTVVPGGCDPGLEPDYQTELAIDNLKFAAEICEKADLVMVLEPLNPWRDHGGVFLTKIPHAYLICRAVGSPACKILFDIYHQQITEGNLIPNIDRAWDEIGYFQIGDNPGRNEPGTGEINYRNIFRHLHAKGWQGILGMEHGNSMPGLAGERAVVAAYRSCDDFE